jgi:hypothetical protein
MLFCTPLLADPPVVFPQGNFSCAVDVTQHRLPPPDPSNPKQPSAPIEKKIAITRVGNIRVDAIVWSDNHVTQVWTHIAEKMSVEAEREGSNKGIWVLPGAARNEIIPALLSFDADSASWMSAQTQTKDSDPASVLHYATPMTLPLPGGRSRVVEYQAWIDSKTLIPVKFDDGDALYVLKFSNNVPAGPLVMPADLQAELERFQSALAPHPHL